MLRQGLGGRVPGSGRPPQIDLSSEALKTATGVLEVVETALEEGDTRQVDRLLAAWKARVRREAGLAALTAAAAAERADPTLPEGWTPGDGVSGAQLSGMGAYQLYVHLCALRGETPMDEFDWAGEGEV